MRYVLLLLVALMLPLPAFAASVVGTGATVTCDTTATALDDPSIDDDKYNRTLLVEVPASAAVPIRWGGPGVKVDSGPTLGGDGQRERLTIRLAPKAKLYCIAASPVQVEVLESY